MPPVQRVADARAEAFRSLVDRRLDAAYRIATVVLDDRVEAEDAVHDAALAAWRAWGDLRDTRRFDAWFQRILINTCRDRLRERTRHRVVDVGRELTESEHPWEPDVADGTATRAVLDRALGQLDPDAQIVVALRYHADMTVPTIAALLQIPEGTVKSRLHHALGRLRATLEEAER